MNIYLGLLLLVWIGLVRADYELHVLHTNDVHARFEEINKYGGQCSPEDSQASKCFGGMARLKTKLDELRSIHKNTVLVDGGDYFQGTIWFHFYKGSAAAHFMNIMKYDAMAVGNHEFDNGPKNTAEFAANLTFPMLSANMKIGEEEPLKNYVKKSVVKIVGGEKIGIIGYTTPDTVELSNVGDHVTFDTVVAGVRAEAQRLTSQGINKIIAIGHAGYNADQKLAKEVTEVDVVVGGHTDTFLYTGERPSIERPVDQYPKVVERSDGSKALVVQDYTFAKYLGNLKVIFDDAGHVKEWSGNPELLSGKVARNPVVQAELENWQVPLRQFTETTIGRSYVFLDGSKLACRQKECNMGNLIADAMVHENLNHADTTKWANAPIAVVNAGGIRNSLNKGNLNLAKVMSVLPFRNTVDIIKIKGSTLLKMLEFSVTQYEEIHGRFLQVSGIRVWYDLSKPEQQRVVRVLVRCYKCVSPSYQELDPNAEYRVLIPAFLVNGGDGYSFLSDLIIERHILGGLNMENLSRHIERIEPVAIGTEGRINIIGENGENYCQTKPEQLAFV